MCEGVVGGHNAVWPPPSDFHGVDLVSNWLELISPEIMTKVDQLNEKEWAKRYGLAVRTLD